MSPKCSNIIKILNRFINLIGIHKKQTLRQPITVVVSGELNRVQSIHE